MPTPELFTTLQTLEDRLDDWIRDATPATAADRARLTPAQQAGLAQLCDLRATLDAAIVNLVSAGLHDPTPALQQAQANLDGITNQVTSLAKDISTLSTVLSAIGTAVSITSTVVSGIVAL